MMFFVVRRIEAHLCLGELLRTKAIHLIVVLFGLGIKGACHAFLDAFFNILLLFEGHSLTLELLLEFGWLGVKPVVIGPLLLEIVCLISSESDRTY